MKTVLVPLANGFEEIEAIAIIDVLRRAGIDVVVAGIPGKIVKGAHQINITADTKLEDVKNESFDAIILPGGDPGYKNLLKSNLILNLVKRYDQGGKLVAAICASPMVLAKAGVLNNRLATIYPGMERDIPKPRDGKVVRDGNIITSQGPGTAMEFALALVEYLEGKDAADKLARVLVFRA